MDNDGSATVKWVGIGMLATLALCLCAAVFTGSVALGTAWYVQRTFDNPSAGGLSTVPPQATPAEFPEQPTPVPPQAETMLETL